MAIPEVMARESTATQLLSYEEYLALPDDGRIIEWVDGRVLFHMPPTPMHQIISSLIEKLLGNYVAVLNLGLVLGAPVEVKLWPNGPSREPDLLFVAADKLFLVGDKRLDGPPDLVVEIVSPTSVTLDRIDKYLEYERAGVREYWIIDPRPFQQQADFYIRNPQGRFVPAEVDSEGNYFSHVVPGFRLHVSWLWQAPTVNPQRALADMLADAPGLSDELRAAYRELRRLME